MELSAEAKTLHDSLVIVDGLQISNWAEPVFRSNHQGGVTAVTATVAVHEGFRQTIKTIAWWHEMFRRNADFIMPIKSVNEVLEAKKTGKTGFIFGFQDTAPIEDDLGLLSIFHALGVRVIQLTYMKANFVGQGCLERFDCGLTDFGIETIEEMNRLGILIDLSHVGYRTSMAAIEVSQKPVAFTHANPKNLRDHPRNKTNEEIRGVAKRGGVIGANIFPAFLPSVNQATIDDYIDVIDYLVEMIGIDHVAVGTDFTEGQPKEFFDWLLTGKSKRGPCMELVHPILNPKGIRQAREFPNITQALMKRRYAERDIKKIMGENWLRLYREVWVE
jgi:membrane dipeptidase